MPIKLQERNWVIYCKEYPTNIYSLPCKTKELAEKNAKSLLEQGKIKEYTVMTFDEFFEVKKSIMLDNKITAISEEDYYDMLEVLPPLRWGNNKGVQSFFMSEFTSGSYTNQYAKGGTEDEPKYFCKQVDYNDYKTWIKLEEVK